jgi:predicted nuclease of restriction endonuclease-like RecB superfamily
MRREQGKKYGHLNEQLDTAQTGFDAGKLEQGLRGRIVGRNETIERTSPDDDTMVFLRPRETIVPLCSKDRPIVADCAS